MKNLLTTKGLTKKQALEIFKWTDKLKNKKKPLLKDKTLGMIFEKPSLRTKASFETAIRHLGGHPIFLPNTEIKLGKRESVADIARVLSRYVDGIVARLFEHEKMVELAKYSQVPVINGLDDLEHPCQALADLYTIKQKKKKLWGLNIAFFGDGHNNTFYSLIYLCNKFNMNVTIACPDKYKPKIKTKYKTTKDPEKAAKDADIIYTDTFVSMGLESQKKKRLKDLKKYKLTRNIVKNAKPNYIFLHPLPAHRGQEVEASIIDGKNSVVFDQAENRLHVQKAILYLLMK